MIALKIDKELEVESDPVCNPSHYLKRLPTPQKLAEMWELPAALMNCIKYLGRYRHKGKPREDLKKAIWYLTREYELECARYEGREPIDIDDKADPHNPFGVAFMRDVEAAQDRLR